MTINEDIVVNSFLTLSPALAISPSAQLTPERDDLLSSFTTLGDDVGPEKKQEVVTMITPPMSQKQQEIKTPSSLNNSNKSISRNEFVDSLISAASVLLKLIWPSNFDKLQIKWFLKETLRRSKSSYCTLQVSLFYIYKLKQTIQSSKSLVFQCPKRTFLTCLILASKFLQDKNYSMKTWSKISGLPLKELISMELQILKSINYDLNLNSQLYSEWSKLLLVCTYVNNTDFNNKNLATLQQLAQIFRRFNLKTNATSSIVVDVESTDNIRPLKRKLDNNEEDDVISKLVKV